MSGSSNSRPSLTVFRVPVQSLSVQWYAPTGSGQPWAHKDCFRDKAREAGRSGIAPMRPRFFMPCRNGPIRSAASPQRTPGQSTKHSLQPGRYVTVPIPYLLLIVRRGIGPATRFALRQSDPGSIITQYEYRGARSFVFPAGRDERLPDCAPLSCFSPPHEGVRGVRLFV